MSETYFIKQHRKDNFTILDNTCIRDCNLSWKAKGVHTYLMSLPDDWKIHITEIVNHSCDGKAALYSAIQMLEQYGYIKKIRNRRKDGCFENTVYQVFEVPEKSEKDIEVHPHSDFPDMENRNVENPVLDNQTLLTTNIVTTKEIKTELTDYEPCSEIKQSVSETVFSCKIKELFGGDYPFDRNFEKGLCDKLIQCEVAESEIESYLEYVFERTRQSNPRKSFAGLFRVLALSGSILNDFQQQVTHHSSQSDGVVQKRQRILLTVQCPVCGTEFVEYDYYCPTCYLSVTAIREHDDREIRLKTVLHKMSSEERQAFDAAREERLRGLNRSFFVGKEYEEFLRDYGIISTDL
ncbi:MAG: hypothetical protein IKB70_04440 [Bacilli bacterium]|nr:hypothetical protein [Bacilli bacterium]